MSTNSECMFFEAEPSKWFYALEQKLDDEESFSWLDDAYVAGPFSTFEEAIQHLGDNHANPGGFSQAGYSGGTPSPRMQALIDRAEKPGPRRRW